MFGQGWLICPYLIPVENDELELWKKVNCSNFEIQNEFINIFFLLMPGEVQNWNIHVQADYNHQGSEDLSRRLVGGHTGKSDN